MELRKKAGETEFQYHKRLICGKLVDKTLADVDYSELAEEVYGQGYSSDVARRMMYGSAKTLELLERDSERGIVDKDIRSEIDAKKIELQKERQKLQTEKLEYDRLLRESSRDELIFEKLIDAISRVEPLARPQSVYHTIDNCRREGVLVFGDEHYGAEFVIRGLHGEVVNAYDITIAERRMEELLEQTIGIIKRENLQVIHVLNMGDFTDGVLRVGQLRKLQLGVVDSTVRYMKYISNWLNDLTKHVRVKFQMVHGNHSELRMLGQPKGTFKDENMGKIVAAYIKIRLADNPNFEFCENPTGLIFDTVLGYNILGIHGEVRNMERAISEFSSIYNTRIDYLLAGHLHHAESCSIGYRRCVIRVPSIVGTDEYALSLNKVSDAGATFFTIEEGIGKRVEYTIYLK